MIQESIESYVNRELVLFKRFLFISLAVHVILLITDPSQFFFSHPPSEAEGTINIDFIAFDKNPPPSQEEEAPAPLLPQVTKKFQLEESKKPDELSFEEKKEIEKPDNKIKESKVNEEELTKVSMERLLKELKRDKDKKGKSLLPESLKERKKELESGLYGTLTLGSKEAGYSSVIKAWVQKNYTLPEISELKNADINAVIELSINGEGGIMKLRLHSSSHNTLFDELALKTVEHSAPFPPPEADWIGKSILLNFAPKTSDQ